jgi:outer membrane protein
MTNRSILWITRLVIHSILGVAAILACAGSACAQVNSTLSSTGGAPVMPYPASSSTTPNQTLQIDQTGQRPLPLPAGARLTLKDAIAIALEYHPLAAQAAAQSGAAEEQVGEARSYLGPQLYGISQYLRTTDNGIGNTSYYNFADVFPRLTGTNHDLPSGDTAKSWNTSNNYANGLGLSQYLLDFGRRRGLVEQRRFEAAATSDEQQLVNLELIFEVSRRYFDVLRTKQLTRVYENAVEGERKSHLREVQLKVKAKLKPQYDLYVAETQVDRGELDLLDARNAQADASLAFDNALGLGGRSPGYQLVDVLTYFNITDDMNSLVRDALRLRPDMKAQENQARAMGAQIAEYRSDYLPTVNAVAGYSALGTGLPAANNFNVGIEITWPIFNSFLTSHQVAEMELRRKAIEAQVEDLRQRIILQVETAFQNWQASLLRIARAEHALAASRVQLDLAEKRYAAGHTDILNLENAERFYTIDGATYVNALYGFSVAKAAVDQATARSLSR